MIKHLVLFVAALAVATAFQKCCPQPESEGKCGCCPDACCCLCQNTTGPPPNCTFAGLDLLFIADRSSSITSDGWVIVKNFISSFLPRFGGVGSHVRAAFITYESQNAQVQWDLASVNTDNEQNFVDAIDAVPYIPAFTNTPEALDLGTNEIFSGNNGDRDDTVYPDVAIVLTDGKTNIGEALLPAASAALQAVTELVFVIATGTEPDFTELNIIADGDNDESVFPVGDLGNLEQEQLADDIESSIRDAFCTAVQNEAPTPVESCKCCCPPNPKKKVDCSCRGM